MRILLPIMLLAITAQACAATTSERGSSASSSDGVRGGPAGPAPRGQNAPAPDVAARAYDFVTHARACEGQRVAPSIPENQRCRRDSDCGVCHDGSRCGTIMRVDLLRKMGAQCRLQDRDECELFGVHCCKGRCVETALSGECKRGSYWVEGKCN